MESMSHTRAHTVAVTKGSGGGGGELGREVIEVKKIDALTLPLPPPEPIGEHFLWFKPSIQLLMLHIMLV